MNSIKKIRVAVICLSSFLMLSTLSFAAKGYVSSLTSGNSYHSGNLSNGIVNTVQYRGDAVEKYENSNNVKNIFVRKVVDIGGRVEANDSNTDHNQTHTYVEGKFSKDADENKKAKIVTQARARYDDDSVSENFSRLDVSLFGFDIARSLNYESTVDENNSSNSENEPWVAESRNKEYDIFVENGLSNSLLNKDNRFYSKSNNEGSNLKYIDISNPTVLNDYPNYLSACMAYYDEHTSIGDYLPVGMYVDDNKGVAYFASISDNTVYEYKFEK